MEQIEKKAFFFSHKECEYFPCHETDHPEDFNCLFCYCPLYMLGDQCGGDYSYTQSGIKNCSACIKPHGRDSAKMIQMRFSEIAERAKQQN